MKRQLLTLVTLVFFTHTFAQNKLHDLLSGERGVSKHLTTLDESHQVVFNSNNARSIFGLDPNSDLVIINTETDHLGMTHYRYAQTYKGIPVENAMYIAHTKGGMLTAMGGAIVTDFTLPTQARLSPSLSPQQAVEAALQ